MARFVLLLVLIAGPALAEPPAVGSEQYEVLHPYADYFSHWKQPDNRGYRMGCCDISDCRMVDTRTRDGHYQARITQADFGPSAPDAWLNVPDDLVDTTPDPERPPFPVACWSAARLQWGNGFYCFSPGSGT